MDKSKRDRILDKLVTTIETVEVANILTTPFNESILNLLRVSASAISAEGASVLLPDGEEDNLRFAWAVGSVSDSLVGMTIPSGKGIAGFVFSTGQPMAVSDAERETSFYAEVDRNTGFSTHTILATPLQFEGEVTGVLEYVNRRGSPPYEPFTPEEMDLAALYADAVASMVHAHGSANILAALSEIILEGEDESDAGEVRAWLAEMEGRARQRDLIDLALLVRELSAAGGPELRFCREILEAFSKYVQEEGEPDLTLL